MYRKILVPLDGSETAENVLPVAREEALHHQATVVLLRVIPPLRGSLMMPPKFLAQISEQATEITQNYLERIAKQVSGEGFQVGDTLAYRGHTTDFEDTVGRIEVNNQPVDQARAGDMVGVKVPDRSIQEPMPAPQGTVSPGRPEWLPARWSRSWP